MTEKDTLCLYEKAIRRNGEVIKENRRLRKRIIKLGYGWNPNVYPEKERKRAK